MNEKKPTNPWAKSLLIWVGILFGLVVFVQMIGGGSKAATGETIAYSEFVRQVDERNVQSVTTSSTASGNQIITGKLEGGQTFRTTAPADAQVTDRLIKAGKIFDQFFVPGGGHGAGGPYGQRKLEDFFVHYILGQEAPDWNDEAGAL